MTSSLYALVLLVWLVCASWGVGALLLGRFRGAWISRAEAFTFAVPLGMGVFSYAIFAGGLLRFLNRGFALALVAAGIGVFIAAVLRNRVSSASVDTRRQGEIGEATRGAVEKPLALFCNAALALIGVCSLIAALAPPGGLEWDALSYHLAAPKLYLAAGRIYYIPFIHQSNFPFTIQMLYTLMLALGSVGAAKLVHWLCGALLVASVYTFCARHLPATVGKRAGLVAAVVVATTPIVLWETTVAYADAAGALFAWLSFYALVNAAGVVKTGVVAPPAPNKGGACSRVTSVSWLIVSAALMGLALGTKTTVLAFWGVCLIGLLGWNYVTTRTWAKETLPHAALWGALSLAIAAPWYIKTLLYTGNPVYPFYYGLFGGRYWNALNAALYAADQNKFGFGKGPVNLLLAPWQVSVPGEGWAQAAKFTEYIPFVLSPVYVALLLAVPLMARRVSRASLCALLFGLGVFAFWFVLMQQTRYLIPALPAFAVAGAEAFLALWDTRRGIARFLGAGVVGASALWGVYLALSLAFFGVRIEGLNIAPPAAPVVFGAQPQDDYVPRAGGFGGVYQASRFINENAPKDAKVALFDETRAFYLDRAYIWATPNHAVGLLPWDTYRDADNWLADFKRRGYTYLLINRRNAPKDDDGQRWRSLLMDAIAGDKVKQAWATPSGGVEVYQIP